MDIDTVVRKAVEEVEVVDVHTHLFPSSHGKLLLWGVDELLTYHYLIAELFRVAPLSLQPDAFYSLSKHDQADLVWKHLFIERTPISEAARGVLTTLKELGLGELVKKRDIDSIRAYFATFTAEEYLEKVFTTARVKYAVMTNIPFDPVEAEHFDSSAKPIPSRLKTALRIDDLFNWKKASAVLKEKGFEESYDGAKAYLRVWKEKMKPEYLMASFPFDLRYPSTTNGVDEMGNIIDGVVIPLAREFNLPVALKCGTQRQVNPQLRQAGDSVGVADVNVIQSLCQRYPDVKFLATFLSKENQHQLIVTARKFRNLHIYGCWWFCNNPSIIDEVSRMRVEMLGLSVTLQHSDARILDQLLYKWSHSRRVIAEVLVEKYKDLVQTGWEVSEEEVKRDVWLLFGGSYEQFMSA
uniref:Glucuronate isomerase n=1 Tax=Palpitomonas bilix TaxID=652834 RepID=A0A7S3G3M0_9EUKA|mmetsp:Transcript_19311/g.49539  ORF Transcript_19311/g.49539 Transcript_19311/m.49539 type:complete len:410 (+) Transcript_19311:272-1501(+)|eukprot:CAMPEP_0113871036 /NCGR_PEP_ID=MMETSP0780_2-20120614/2416_1 /TAXON_ID=652834 /ORGANISM="Palpitomonas bilix" /LENGTH=409 /DNA_ID=CAMNT_0000856375 /DNA_START=151 /DNA_END=1380 /DNA_ORIENTATION=+ /assembly_acc=CAM_ASM_000599